MTTSPPPHLHTPDEDYPLHEFHLQLAGREWRVLHTGVVLTHADEVVFLGDMLTKLPYGVALWPSAIALAHELAARTEELHGKHVLELGAGTGLPGIVAASLGARVLQTDRQELALSISRRNSQRNGIIEIEQRLADWTDWHDEERYDWIVGSDILYTEALHPNLEHIFQTNLAPGGRVLIADPFRAPSVRFLEALQSEGWEVAVTKWNLGDPESPRAIGIFELVRPLPPPPAGRVPGSPERGGGERMVPIPLSSQERG